MQVDSVNNLGREQKYNETYTVQLQNVHFVMGLYTGNIFI